VKRILSGILGVLAGLGGFVAFSYASMAAGDFRNPAVSIWTALLGSVLIWLLTLGAFGFAVHLLKYSIAGEPFHIPGWMRALILGALSFFPGFLLSLVPMALWVSHRWPRDNHAQERALLVSACVGLASVVLVSVVLLKKSSRRSIVSR